MTLSSIPSSFEELDYDFPHEWFQDAEFVDCTLDDNELKEFLTPSTESWKDLTSSEHGSKFTIDSSKKYQWDLAKKEIEHIRNKCEEDIRSNNAQSMSIDEAMIFNFLGRRSAARSFLSEEMELNEEDWLKFLATFSLQAAYRVSSTELFSNDSRLKKDAPMSEEEYRGVWRRMSEKKKLARHDMRTARSPTPLWETLETIVNTVLCDTSITGREGRISIALDDDKIWFASSVSKVADLFNMKFTTHTEPNRKGIVAHTAVSSGANVPLGIIFERTKDSSTTCFKRLLDFLFSHDGTTELRNVSVHSDRGYLLPNLVFQYILAQGGEVLGTIKRMALYWPFTFLQNLSENDKRTKIDVKGAPTLFMKYVKAGSKFLFAAAFRNGTERVATAISSIHKSHEWEGVSLVPGVTRTYEKEGGQGLKPLFFKKSHYLMISFSVRENIQQNRINMNQAWRNCWMTCWKVRSCRTLFCKV